MLKSTFGAVLALIGIAAAVNVPETRSDLTVHEWGTFTSVAGEDGRAVPWRPLAGAADLPCFVERASLPPKFSFRTTVRMETPVIYFYAGRPLTVDVAVRFRQGLMTEFFPHANSRADRLDWTNVQVRPGHHVDFIEENAPSHYYAARAAQAAPVRAAGQDEGFLFYRGVGGFELPVRATENAAGQMDIVNGGPEPISAVMLFENRGGRIGFRMQTNLADRLLLPAADLDGDVSDVRFALTRMLIAEGLYPREAEAMVATWSDSWFEAGTRLFYVVPRPLVDRTLPLEITPEPAYLTRVFVGRLEIATATTLSAIDDALMRGDTAALEAHGRFLEPFSQRLLARDMTEEQRARIKGMLARMAGPVKDQPCESTTLSDR